MAAGLSDYSGGKNKNITDVSMGQLRFIMKSYGYGEISGINFKELETRPCTDADFNYAADHDDVYTQFYPVEASQDKDLVTYGPGTMECPKYPQHFSIRGSYDSLLADNLMVVFEKCNDANKPKGTVCKSE